MPTAFSQLPVFNSDIKFVAGDDVEILCTLKETGIPIDLTYYSYESVIILNDGSTIAFVIIPTLLTAGQITLTLARNITAGIPLGEYTWYLKITSISDNYARTWAKGACIVS